MTTISIEVDDELAAQIKRQADARQQSLEEWMRDLATSATLHKTTIENNASTQTIPDEEFQMIARRVVDENAELLRRLAQ